MNRRGFLGALVGVPLAAAVTKPAPVELAGLSGWIPVDPSPFFGIDRGVAPSSLSGLWEGPSYDLRPALIEAADRLWLVIPRGWEPRTS